jgi:hypothetical protein
MTTDGRDWLAARAHEGHPDADVYRLQEAYAGEHAELVSELKSALGGCDDPEHDRLGTAMRAAIQLDALPVLRAIVAVWRDAYRGLLAEVEGPEVTVAALAPEERMPLLALRQRVHQASRDR